MGSYGISIADYEKARVETASNIVQIYIDIMKKINTKYLKDQV
jgi:hypothetical protein